MFMPSTRAPVFNRLWAAPSPHTKIPPPPQRKVGQLAPTPPPNVPSRHFRHQHQNKRCPPFGLRLRSKARAQLPLSAGPFTSRQPQKLLHRAPHSPLKSAMPLPSQTANQAQPARAPPHRPHHRAALSAFRIRVYLWDGHESSAKLRHLVARSSGHTGECHGATPAPSSKATKLHRLRPPHSKTSR
jgi:hypothetical protein